MSLLDRLNLEHPVVQAGMGGGVVGPELAGAVSAAGALGTVGILPPPAFRAALLGAQERAPGRPVAANLLVPFARAAHVRSCIDARAKVVVLHGGLGRRWFPRLQDAGIPVMVTVGSLAQAARAAAAGADGLVVQGVEAGGHLMDEVPLDELLAQVRAAHPGLPLFAAGGIADGSDVRRVLAAGATAAVAGTRFLLTEESRAHPDYKRRVVGADRTLRTVLFGVGWPLAHRVVANAATERWCGTDGAAPGWVALAERATAPLGRVLPLRANAVLTARQRLGVPLFGPGLPTAGMPADAVDVCALYAGETVRRLDDVVPAREAVARLLP